MTYFMDYNFSSDESLYRAINPANGFWKPNGSLSSAAFKDNKGGLSVDRGNYRQDSEVVIDMKQRLKGSIVKFSVEDCLNIEARVQYDPNEEDQYHSLVLGKDKISLSGSQARKLCNMFEVVYKDVSQ